MKINEKKLEDNKTNEKRKLEIFKKIAYGNDNFNNTELHELATELETILEVNDLGKFWLYSTLVNFNNKLSIKSKEYLENKFKVQKYYNHILKKTLDLSNELNIESSLRSSNLFSYLLWNGYFSKDKRFVFQSSDRKLIEGVYSYDIVNSIGVCLNISSMLTDYLNFVGYSSATLINHISGSKPNYLINMERQKGKENFRTKALSVILKPISKNAYNHAFNLIDDNNKLYIYDATNFLIFNIETKYSATALKADINAKLNPYLSYILNLDEKSIQVLDKINLLENNENFEMQNFDSLLNNDIDFFRDNDTLFNEFYYDVKPDIDQISKVINNSKQLKKDIRKSLYI